MKKILAIILASLALPLLAEVAPVYYFEDEVVEETVAGEQETAQTAQGAPNTAAVPVQPLPKIVAIQPPAGVAAQRATSAAANSRQTVRQPQIQATSRAVGARPTAATPTRTTTAARPVSARTAATQAIAAAKDNQDAATPSRNAGASRAAPARTAATPSGASRASGAGAKAVQARAGSLYNANAARVGLVGTPLTAATPGVVSRSSTLGPSGKLYNATPSANANIDFAAASQTAAEKMDYCKTQYASCMDQFCDVLDDNQGRCSCSSNVNKYDKTEDALKKATEELQDVAAKIRYIGLTKDEIISLFTQTEAEVAMQGSKDNSDIKSSLDKIQKLIVDPTSSADLAGGAFLIDMSFFDFGNGFDLNSFLGGETTARQRGAVLFDTARSRCASIITECRKQDVDVNLITGHYDLEVDKQCISYERMLDDENTQMRMTIRNANLVLQQARLMVAQNKNKYDLKGCVMALDECMTDDFICGQDYKHCLDTSGQFILNGEILIGSNASNANLSEDITIRIDNRNISVKNEEESFKTFFREKIGKIDTETGRTTGMCAYILNQCQHQTLTNGQYNKDNAVVKQYLDRTMSRIRGKQCDLLADYGEHCRQDIISCFARNGATSARPSMDLTTTTSACYAHIRTCASVLEIEEDFSDDISVYVCSNAKDPKTGIIIKDRDGKDVWKRLHHGGYCHNPPEDEYK